MLPNSDNTDGGYALSNQFVVKKNHRSSITIKRCFKYEHYKFVHDFEHYGGILNIFSNAYVQYQGRIRALIQYKDVVLPV